MVEPLEDVLAHHRPIIITPARNHRIQSTNHSLLGGGLILANHLSKPPIVRFDGLRTRFDERFEALSRG